jgi:hypothetical protein
MKLIKAGAPSGQQRAAGVGISELHMSIRFPAEISYGRRARRRYFFIAPGGAISLSRQAALLFRAMRRYCYRALRRSPTAVSRRHRDEAARARLDADYLPQRHKLHGAERGQKFRLRR